jgi:hypothetical protein
MARFETCARLLAHVNEPESHMRKFLLCPVSTCPLAVSQIPLQKNKSPLHFRKHQKRGEMTGDEIVQEIKPEQSSRCDLYDVIIQDAYIDMSWTENLNDKVIEARDYPLKEMVDILSLQSRHVPGHGTEDGSEDGSEDGLNDELVDDLEEGPGDDMEDGLSNDSGSGPKEDSNISFGYVLTALIVT